MITRDTLISGVLAATDRLVDQASQGDWSSAKQTVEQRRMFLHALAQSEPKAGDHDFLKILQAAAAESDAAIAAMSSSYKSPSKSIPNSSTAPAPSGKSTICLKA